ncbi:virulence factor family protein [Xanthomonas albilineans]|uniref:Putative type iv secretion system virj-like protein n=1 Tax=Xanthomonas albilineans (strain GPE PC73 / CFBP 7063) TaxID=380358 RepID=D2UCI9_XANAP|nr:AcvB/VirJ family lysyl-phosphatidylglycerol hydrolase [Xanthomonas albilineans]QHQ27543.1 putative type IV secretion system virj-like protein [Xanthomonas albilineans]CBA15328.1 putative type iv secretion system virj-like protein [Xanthomonas albilineans GPE PC73]
MKLLRILLLMCMVLGLSGYVLFRYYFPQCTLHSKGYGRATLVHPPAVPQGLVILLASGSAAQRQDAATRIAATGVLVAVVDGERYLEHLGRAEHRCDKAWRDAEHLSRHLQRELHGDSYFLPMLAGTGRMATLVERIVGAAPGATLSGAVGVAPLPTEVCAGRGGAIPAQSFVDTVAAPATGTPEAALATRVAAHLHASGRGGVLDDLPLIEMSVPRAGAPLAIVLSGDGGWRDIDKGIAEALQRRGIAVVGWDSLRYFWRVKSPAQSSADLSRVIAYYQQRWRSQKILLVGYSFGAATLPFMYNRLPSSQRSEVGLLALLGLADKADFQIRVRGWLHLGETDDALAVLPEVARIAPSQLLCVYGDKEKDTLCPSLRARGAQVVALHGGHHFDERPAGLASIVENRWQQLSVNEEISSIEFEASVPPSLATSVAPSHVPAVVRE